LKMSKYTPNKMANTKTIIAVNTVDCFINILYLIFFDDIYVH
jgi:hypothetical protein